MIEYNWNISNQLVPVRRHLGHIKQTKHTGYNSSVFCDIKANHLQNTIFVPQYKQKQQGNITMNFERVERTVALPASIEKCWRLLQRTDTLIKVAEGIMTYGGANDLPEHWSPDNPVVNLKPRLFGIPQGNHFVQVTSLDEENHTIVTNEYGGHIKSWVHTMNLVEVDQFQCLYTDTIEIDAGRRTKLVAWFAHHFYGHRQRRWKEILV